MNKMSGMGGHMTASLLTEARFIYASLTRQAADLEWAQKLHAAHHLRDLRDHKIDMIRARLRDRGYYGPIAGLVVSH